MSTFKPEVLSGMGFPDPLRGESQGRYVWRICAGGYSINTRQARCVGIANLNSVVSTIRNKRKLPLSSKLVSVIDPATSLFDPVPVLLVWVDPSDATEYEASKKVSAPTE
ncbi:hypothetical protein [Aeromonas veronii]|uniref:hypothetical protein n=1 Tax=Aeromonas veronii TaxID=654 RepID=UPI0018F23B6D|nr:hypothetical protein [Aeromonas veronii]MBJ7591725.1 hypothetical protein [Aeromonas veronii]